MIAYTIILSINITIIVSSFAFLVLFIIYACHNKKKDKKDTKDDKIYDMIDDEKDDTIDDKKDDMTDDNKDGDINIYDNIYFMILNIVILIDCILRFRWHEKHEVFKYIQAFGLAFFDKFLLTILTSQSILYCYNIRRDNKEEEHNKIGDAEIEDKNKKIILNDKKFYFFFTFIFSMMSIIVYFIFVLSISKSFAVSNYEDKNYGGNDYYYYIGNYKVKSIADLIFNSFFAFITFLCNSFSVYFLCKLKIKNKNEDKICCCTHENFRITKIVIMLVSIIILFAESFVIILKVIPFEYIDLFYLPTCLLLDIFFNCKKEIFCFCTKKYKKANSLTEILPANTIL